jgi:predicted nucleotidyltransferase
MPSRPDLHASALQSLADRFALADIYVFGSRADAFASGGAARASFGGVLSDVDIAVRPRPDTHLGPAQRVDLTLALEQALDASPVDLLVLPEAGAFLALAAIRGNLLFCSDPDDQAEYELFVLRSAGDLAPLERERQALVLAGGR